MISSSWQLLGYDFTYPSSSSSRHNLNDINNRQKQMEPWIQWKTICNEQIERLKHWCVIFIVLFWCKTKKELFITREIRVRRVAEEARKYCAIFNSLSDQNGKLWKLIKIYMMNGVVDKLCLNISISKLICFGLVFIARCIGEFVFWNHFI